MSESESEDRFPIPLMKEAVYQYELVRRRVGEPVLAPAGPENLAEWARRTFDGITDDRLLLIGIGADSKVLGYEVLHQGAAPVETKVADANIMRTIVQLGLRRFALVRLTLAMDKPELSDSDKEFLVHIGHSAGHLGVELLDMIVVAENDWLSARRMASDAHGDRLRKEIAEGYNIPEEDLMLIEQDKENLTGILREILSTLDIDPSTVDNIESEGDITRLFDMLAERANGDPEKLRQASEAAENAIRRAVQNQKDGVKDSDFRTLEDLMGGDTTDLEDGTDKWGPPINDLPA